MPPKAAAKAKPRPITWKVVGGAMSGGLIVRSGPETTSIEYPEKLSTGSVILELEVQGQRMKYKRVKGTGPDEGWISTQFKGKDLLKRRPFTVWTLCAGTRGDLQPYLALNLGLQEAGYDVVIWSCEDYRGFVESFGVKFFDICKSCEVFIKQTLGVTDPKKEKEAGKPVDMSVQWDEEEAQKQLKGKADWARLSLSLCYLCPVGGVDARDAQLTPSMEEVLPADAAIGLTVAYATGLAAGGQQELADAWGTEAQRRVDLKAEKEAKEWAEWEAQQYQQSTEAAAPAEAAPAPESTEEVPQETVPEEAREPSEAEKRYEYACWAAAAADPANEEAQNALATYREISKNIKELNLSNGELLIYGMEGFFIGFHVSDDAKTAQFKEQLERNPPDLILYNVFWSQIAWAVEWKYGVPAIYLALQPSGMVMDDPTAAWMTPEAFAFVQQANPALAAYPDLETARQHYEMKDVISYTHWAVNLAMESVLIEPLYGVTPVADMGASGLHRRLTEKHLVGFLSSVASKRFLRLMGDFCTAQASKHTYTGFWIMDEKHQGSSKTDMFGGDVLRRKVEDFIAAGDAPAYIGWGSCICQRGRHWMIALAVSGLHKAGMRGIILAGWAELTTALLQDLLGSEDQTGLLEYAKRNILFIEKAPQVWLFPKCSVLVIHGGVGTLAAAWTSGTPLIVLPVWLDQFPNAWLNMLMGAGIRTNSVDECSPDELAYVLRAAVEDPQYKRGAEAVQLSMMMDKGIQTATEHIDHFLLEEVPSNRWLYRFMD